MLAADEASLPIAVEHLRAGEPIVFPTDTVYGLGAHYAIEAGVLKIYEIKGRPRDKAIPLLLADAESITDVVKHVPPVAHALMARFFPGPLTLVLPKADSVPHWITSGEPSVAVRVPNHAFTRSLIRELGAPVATTSANLSGMPAPTTAQEAYSQLRGRVNLILDGGLCPGGQESSVLDITGPVPLLLREGAISRNVLEEVCGPVAVMVE